MTDDMEYGGSTRLRLVTATVLVAPVTIVLLIVPQGVFLVVALAIILFGLSQRHSTGFVRGVHVICAIAAVALLVFALAKFPGAVEQDQSQMHVMSQSSAALAYWMLFFMAEAAIAGVALFAGARTEDEFFLYQKGCLVSLIVATTLLIILILLLASGG